MIQRSERLRQLATVNSLTLARLMAGFASVFVFPYPQSGSWLIGIFAFILVSDVLDGVLARLWNVATVAGSIFDYTVDYFNSYLQIAILVSVGVPVMVFLAYMVRDLLYVFWRVYAPEEREAGVLSLTIIGTSTCYFYVLYYDLGYEVSFYFNMGLLAAYLLSATHLAWRLYRLRRDILDQIYGELSV